MSIPKFLLITTVSLFVLTGMTSCGVRGSSLYELPPEVLLQDCAITAPITSSEYLAMTEEQREAFWAELNRSNIANLLACNSNKKQLREWKRRMEVLINDYAG